MGKEKVFMRQMVSLTLVVFVALFLAISSAGAASPQYGGILKIVDVAEGAQPLGSPWDVRGIDSKLVHPVLDPLVREDINGNYHPWLATGWKIDQAKNTITVSLRKGVKFHDGTDLNATVVKWCIEQAMAAKQLINFLSVDVIDDYTFRVNLKQYQNNVLSSLAGSPTYPVSPLTFEKKGKEFAMWNPVGTGPFKFVSYERGSKLTFTKWEGYWQKGKPYLDGIEYLFIRDEMTQQAAMRASGPEKLQILCVTSGEQAAMMKARGSKC
jgi:peptide/nickel transport system substrate-binding protein